MRPVQQLLISFAKKAENFIKDCCAFYSVQQFFLTLVVYTKKQFVLKMIETFFAKKMKAPSRVCFDMALK